MNMITRQLNVSHLFLSLIFVIWQSGCAHQRPLLSEEIRAELGTIGVVSARFVPEVELERPAAGSLSGMGRGAAAGAAEGFTSGAQVLNSPQLCSGLACGVVLLLGLAAIVTGTIGGTLVGSVHGAVTAQDAETVEEAKAALAHVLDSLRMQEVLRDHVLEEARNQTNYSIRILNDRGPATRDETINYQTLATQGIDTVFELGIESIGLSGELGVDPPLAIVMKVRTKLLRIQDGALLYDSTFPYKSGIHRFTEWAAHDAHLFREGLDSTYRTLAREIVEELFLLYRFPNI